MILLDLGILRNRKTIIGIYTAKGIKIYCTMEYDIIF